MPPKRGSLLSRRINYKPKMELCFPVLDEKVPMTLLEVSIDTPVFEDSDKEDLMEECLVSPTYSISPPPPVPVKQMTFHLPLRQPAKETIVHKGFGPFIFRESRSSYTKGSHSRASVSTQDHQVGFSRAKRSSYPPAANAAYDPVMEYGLEHQAPKWQPKFDGAAFVKQQLLDEAIRDEMRNQEINKYTAGQLAARDINWGRKTFDEDDLIFAFDEDETLIKDEVEHFISGIDNATAKGQEMFDYCKKCGEHHIPWGAPITLQDRDTCNSMLPEWFPAYLFNKPWDAFIELVNDLVKFDEIAQGLRKNPLEPSKFDMGYHMESDEWKRAGREEGWWKCRSGGPNVPWMEQQCTLCHKPVNEAEEQKLAFERRYEKVHDWFQRYIEEGARKDRAVVQNDLWKAMHGL